jgi:hypothetical protein
LLGLLLAIRSEPARKFSHKRKQPDRSIGLIRSGLSLVIVLVDLPFAIFLTVRRDIVLLLFFHLQLFLIFHLDNINQLENLQTQPRPWNLESGSGQSNLSSYGQCLAYTSSAFGTNGAKGFLVSKKIPYSLFFGLSEAVPGQTRLKSECCGLHLSP